VRASDEYTAGAVPTTLCVQCGVDPYLGSVLGGGEVDEAEATADTRFVEHNLETCRTRYRVGDKTRDWICAKWKSGARERRDSVSRNRGTKRVMLLGLWHRPRSVMGPGGFLARSIRYCIALANPRARVAVVRVKRAEQSQ
jgi:hypothetical protein